MITHDDVRRIALAMPGAEERPSYGGRPSWRAGNRMFTWIRDDPEALVLWVATDDDKESLLAADPDVFFTTPHYAGQSMVLVRLEAVDLDEASELIIESWRARAPTRLVKTWDAEHA